MLELIIFSLGKRFLSKTSIAANAVLFLVFGLIIHMDMFVSLNKVEVVYLNNSVQEYFDDFLCLDTESYEYKISNKKENPNSVIIHLDEKWYIYSDGKINDETLSRIKSDILKVRQRHFISETDMKTRQFINNYLDLEYVEVYDKDGKEEDYSWLLLSLIYFIIMSYGTVLANEVLYEKATRTISLLLTSIEAEEHFWAKVLTGYLSLFIQLISALFYLGVWLIVRQLLFGFDGLFDLLSAYSDRQITGISSMPAGSALFGVLFVIVGVVTVQLLLLIVVNGLKSGEDVSNFQSPFYIVLMMLYYYLLINGTAEFYTSAASRVLSHVPLSCIVFMPCRLFLDDASVLEGIISLMTAVIFLGFLIKWYLPEYKRKLLE